MAPSLYGAPIATIEPLPDNDTEYPNWSPAASPSISSPNWFHDIPFHLYTRTCPESVLVPSLYGAPIATIVPSPDNDTEYPKLSPPLSPSISLPNWTHNDVVLLYSYTRACPESVPLMPLFFIAPIATLVPSFDNDTEYPDSSLPLSPSISSPFCIQYSFVLLYISDCSVATLLLLNSFSDIVLYL